MLKYIVRRIVIFIPTLAMISLAAFFISVNAPGDPVERLLRAADSEGGASEQSQSAADQRRELERDLGLDRPVFYLTFKTAAEPDTLWKVSDKSQRSSLRKIVNSNGNWDKVQAYFLALQKAEAAHQLINVDAIVENSRVPEDIERLDSLTGETYIETIMKRTLDKNFVQDKKNTSNQEFVGLLQTSDPTIIQAKFDSLSSMYAKHEFLAPAATAFAGVEAAYQDMNGNPQAIKTFIPGINWHGYFNQYHLWLFGDVPYLPGKKKRYLADLDDPTKSVLPRTRLGLFRGDFGKSFQNGLPIAEAIGERVKWSLRLAFLGILFAYIVSIPIGIYSAYRRDGTFDRVTSFILFALYSLPVFFVGTWLLYTFSNPDNVVWFPSSGIMDPATFDPDASWWERYKHRLPYFVLPVLTYTYGSLAYLSRIMRVGMIEVFGQDYIRTARAKGLSERKVVMKHALRNSLIPIITVFASIFPVAIGGSVIIEMIFSYPGMGFWIFESVINQDYPVIVTVFTILGFFTMIGYLVSDVLYGVVDPRISYK